MSGWIEILVGLSIQQLDDGSENHTADNLRFEQSFHFFLTRHFYRLFNGFRFSTQIIVIILIVALFLRQKQIYCSI